MGQRCQVASSERRQVLWTRPTAAHLELQLRPVLKHLLWLGLQRQNGTPRVAGDCLIECTRSFCSGYLVLHDALGAEAEHA